MTQTRKAPASAYNLDTPDNPSTPDSAQITFTDETVDRVRELRGALVNFGAACITVHSMPGLHVQWLDEDGKDWEDPDCIRLRTPVIRVYNDHVVYTELTRDDDGSVAVRFDTEPQAATATA